MPRKRFRNKRRANILHFKKRLYERYAIDLTFEEIDRLALFITNSGVKYFIQRLSTTRNLFKVPIDDQDVLVIYDKKQHSLLTALPEGSEVDDYYQESIDNHS
jgi:hypothetical protein